jgi:hypothetical protein
MVDTVNEDVSLSTAELKENTQNLINFLRDLANSMERGDLPSAKMQRIGEFFMKYKFHEQADKDTMKEDFMKDNQNDFTEEEFTKFLCMGWYCYHTFLNNEDL